MFETADTAFADAIGMFGVALYLGSYGAMQLGFVRGQTYTYAGLNFAAAGCVLISLQESFNLSSASIQIFWILISVVGMLRLYLISRKIRFTAEEAAFLDTKLKLLPKHLGRWLLDNGQWVSGEPGHQITLEGRPVERLIYLADGSARVVVSGHDVGQCPAGSFIGELTCMKGDPATATVTLAEPSRYFCIAASRLRDLATRQPELQYALEVSFAGDVRRKLARANENQRRMARQEGAPAVPGQHGASGAGQPSERIGAVASPPH